MAFYPLASSLVFEFEFILQRILSVNGSFHGMYFLIGAFQHLDYLVLNLCVRGADQQAQLQPGAGDVPQSSILNAPFLSPCEPAAPPTVHRCTVRTRSTIHTVVLNTRDRREGGRGQGAGDISACALSRLYGVQCLLERRVQQGT